jgi:hypothetical protein
VNYKVHNDLSWFRPLLGGNSPTSSGLILKMNMCYKGMSIELKKVHVVKAEMEIVPLPDNYRLVTFTLWSKLHGQWGPRLRRSVRSE